MLKILAPIAAIGSVLPLSAAAGPEPVATEPSMSAPAPAAVDWSGPYLGLTFGTAFGNGEAEVGDNFGNLIPSDIERGLFPRDIDDGETGAMAGFTLGYNVQRGNAVGGVEFDISVLNQEVRAEFSEFDRIFETDTDTTYGTEISGLATLRLRAGFARDRNLFYGTFGMAAGQVENEFALALPGLAYSSSWSEEGTRYGYVVGAGVERQISQRLSLKGEVLYYDLENVTVEGRDVFLGVPEGIDYRFQNDGYVARIGINFAF